MPTLMVFVRIPDLRIKEIDRLHDNWIIRTMNLLEKDFGDQFRFAVVIANGDGEQIANTYGINAQEGNYRPRIFLVLGELMYEMPY